MMISPHPHSDDLTVWGLTSRDLHQAWWRGLGIQVVESGRSFEPARGVELYLLVPASRLVAFSIEDIVERVIWSRARALRLEVVERDFERYREDITRDKEGAVCGLSRSYTGGNPVSLSIGLSTDASDAAIWAGGDEAAHELLESIADCDTERVLGHVYHCERTEEERRFVSWLVAVWPDPDRVIEGLTEVEKGVFSAKETPESGLKVISPVWIGHAGGDEGSDQRIFAGPDFLPDRIGPDGEIPRLAIREIRDVEVRGGEQQKRLLPRRTFYGLFKRGYDTIVAALALLVLSPLLLFTCILVAIDDGLPIFFGHERQARGGRNFKCWKFRTMRRDAESMVAELQALNKADGPQVFIENDPRVTRIGRMLRKTQIDELPQLWNVIRGDMSFVGPRPSPERENQFCPAWREMRLSVRPGITGLWQLRRTRTPGEDFQEWIKYDVEYVRTASTLLDLKVVFLTAFQILGRQS